MKKVKLLYKEIKKKEIHSRGKHISFQKIETKKVLRLIDKIHFKIKNYLLIINNYLLYNIKDTKL